MEDYSKMLTDEFTKDTLIGSGKEFKAYTIQPSDFMQSLALFGGSGSGKTFMTKHVLYSLKDRFARVILFSPHAISERDFDGILHPLQIIPKITEEKFLEIYEAQDQIAKTYGKVTDLKNLRYLFNLVANSEQKGKVQWIENERTTISNNIRSAHPPNIALGKIQDLNKKIDAELVNYIRAVIMPVRHIVLEELPEDVNICLRYLDMKPDTLIIFDDQMIECAAIMKKKSRAAEAFKNMFTQGRHIFLTHFHLLQSDTLFPPIARLNIKTYIFTSSDFANKFVQNTTNGISKEDQVDARKLINSLYSGEDHRKMIYLRDAQKGEKFQHLLAKPSGVFPLGSKIIQSFCENLQKNFSK